MSSVVWTISMVLAMAAVIKQEFDWAAMFYLNAIIIWQTRSDRP